MKLLHVFFLLFLSVSVAVAQGNDKGKGKSKGAEKGKGAQKSASAKPAPVTGPQITFTSTTIDYGTIKQGADGVRMFTFKNTGKENLILSSCSGSCGCTVPTCPQEAIPPKGTGSIKVQYDTNRIGAFTKTVTVNSNDPAGPKVLTITGTVTQ